MELKDRGFLFPCRYTKPVALLQDSCILPPSPTGHANRQGREMDSKTLTQTLQAAADAAEVATDAIRAAVAELIGDVVAFISDHDHGLGPDIGRLRAALKAVEMDSKLGPDIGRLRAALKAVQP